MHSKTPFLMICNKIMLSFLAMLLPCKTRMHWFDKLSKIINFLVLQWYIQMNLWQADRLIVHWQTFKIICDRVIGLLSRDFGRWCARRDHRDLDHFQWCFLDRGWFSGLWKLIIKINYIAIQFHIGPEKFKKSRPKNSWN